MLLTTWETTRRASRIPNEPGYSDNLSSEQLAALHQLYERRMSPWHQQVYLCFCHDIKQQLRDKTTFMMEIFAGVLTGLLIGLAMYELDGRLYVGLYLEPFRLLSSAVNYDQVPKMGVLICLPISFASAAPGVTVFSVETQLFHRESHSGHSESAYFVGKALISLLRSLLSSLHFTSFYMILATLVISFGMLLGLNLLYFYCVYSLGTMMAALTKRGNEPLGCLLLSIIIAVLSGYAPRIAAVKEWHLAWLWYTCPGTWYIEAFLAEHILPFSYLYDINATEVYTGYTTGRTNFDIGLVLTIGTVYRVIGCTLMVIRARKSWW